MKPDRFESPIEDATLEKEIEAALAVDHSPNFAARVFVRIASAPTSHQHRSWWVFATAAGLAATIALSLWIPRLREAPERPGRAVTPITASAGLAPTEEAGAPDVDVEMPLRSRPQEVPDTETRETEAMLPPVEISKITIDPLSIPGIDLTPITLVAISIEPLSKANEGVLQ